MADGPGFRTSIYCAGCKHACKGCHNPQSWDFKGGKEMDVEELLEIVKADDLSDVSFSGGDPFYQVEAFTELARRIKETWTSWWTALSSWSSGTRTCCSAAAPTNASSTSTANRPRTISPAR